jgi:hypothetical protein
MKASQRTSIKRSAWIALALTPLLSGCVAAVALPLLAGGTLMANDGRHVRAATQVPTSARSAAPAPSGTPTPQGTSQAAATLTPLKELPPPGVAARAAADDPWQQFFAYGQRGLAPKEGQTEGMVSALLKQPPDIDSPVRAECSAPTPAVVIDLDDGSEGFAPQRLAQVPAGIADGLARLREAGFVVLWISRLPAARAADVAQALRTSGLDPRGQDQLLLVRNIKDRKQILREDASEDVCVVAIAGDQRGDFDELFDYLRNPGSAVGLYPMMGEGWFLVPSLSTPAKPSTER